MSTTEGTKGQKGAPKGVRHRSEGVRHRSEGVRHRSEGVRHRIGHRRWIFKSFVRRGVRYTLGLSLLILLLYTAGSMPDPGLPDRVLFLLLQILQYASLVLCVFSLFSLGFSIRRLVHHPHGHNIPAIFFYFCTGVLGAGLAMLNSLIVATTGAYG